MLNPIDNFLNKITMYRLVLYVLVFFFFSAVALSIFKLLPYTPIDLLGSFFVILTVSYISNKVFSYIYKAPTNVESIYISAFILFFIITPAQGGIYSQFFALAIWASIWSMASKYIITINRKHIFNPVAFAVLLTAFTINQSASWWIGTPNMLLFVLIGGLLIIRKLRRGDMMLGFTISALVTIIGFTIFKDGDVFNTIFITLKNSAFFFFAFIMLTEPLTAPTTKWLRIIYAILVGFLFSPALHIGSFYSTPELALIIGNIFAYIVSPKEKLFLKLKKRVKIGIDTYDFIFTKNEEFHFKPGQYMEWTLKHRSPDSRGNRRYFTIASSPTEQEIHLGVKFYPEPSSYKNRLFVLPPGEEIIATQKSGDFVLPSNKEKSLVFIAGGIGITPFRSMIQYLLDIKEKRQIILLYSNKTVEDISYKEVFSRAEIELGIKTIYIITDNKETPFGPNMYSGMIDAEMIQKEIPNFTDNIFYISGPHGMVNAFENTLKSLGVHHKNIKIDFFPGFA